MKSVSFSALSSYTKNVRDRLKRRTSGTNTNIAVCLSIISTLLLPALMYDRTIGFSNSFYSVAYAIVLFLLFKWYYGRQHCRRELLLTHAFGLLLACMTTMGRAIEQTGRFFPVRLAVCVSILIYTHVFACAVSLLWQKL